MSCADFNHGARAPGGTNEKDLCSIFNLRRVHGIREILIYIGEPINKRRFTYCFLLLSKIIKSGPIPLTVSMSLPEKFETKKRKSLQNRL